MALTMMSFVKSYCLSGIISLATKRSSNHSKR
jgi:hypothetical protein